MKTADEKREIAEMHWKYTEGLLKAIGKQPTPLEHYLYVQAFLHGMKHGEKEGK